MTLVPPRGERALPVLSGVLLALAFPPAAFLLPSFVALVPLLVFIAARPAGAAGRWSATRAGLVTGVVFFGLRLYWMAVALLDSALAIPAYILTVLVLAAVTAAFGWALHLTRDRLALPLPVLAGVLWAAMEWTHAHLGPFAFPWLALGTSLAPFPRLAGAADLVGTSGLGLWLAAVNGAIAGLVARRAAGPGAGETGGWSAEGWSAWRRSVHGRSAGGRPTAALGAALGAALLIVVPLAYGLLRASTLELREAAHVTLVQSDFARGAARRAARGVVRGTAPRGDDAADRSFAVLAALTREGTAAGEPARPGGGRDLVVWPEVAIPAALDTAPRLVDSVAALALLAGAPILAGAYGSGLDGAVHNSAFLVTGEGLAGRYDKRILVPFIERVPAPGRARAGDLAPGRDGPLLHLASGARFGVLICYESVFSRLARDYRRDGADFIVAIVNDGWYGLDTWYGRTTALWQHPAHLVLRAIETRTGVVRAANIGFSQVIDPLGRVRARTPLLHEATITAPVQTTGSITPFTRTGDVVGVGSFLVALVGIFAALYLPGLVGDRE